MSEYVGTIRDPNDYGAGNNGDPSGVNGPAPSEVPDDAESGKVCVIEAPTNPEEVPRP